MSIRRACDVLKAERSSYHYKSRRGDQADLKKRIKEIAEVRVRYALHSDGYEAYGVDFAAHTRLAAHSPLSL